jgi:hypothetical protein
MHYAGSGMDVMPTAWAKHKERTADATEEPTLKDVVQLDLIDRVPGVASSAELHSGMSALTPGQESTVEEESDAA